MRLDYLDSLTSFDFDAIISYRQRMILTVRDMAEGGVKVHDADQKRKFLEEAMKRGFLVDVEAEYAEKYGFDCTGRIVSRHYFDHDPSFDELVKFVETYSGKARITKIALRSNDHSRITLARLLGEFSNLSVMETDGEGSSRILYSILGSKLLYCHTGEKTSPGQISCSEAEQILTILRKKD